MISNRRWDPCIYHRGDPADAFLQEYLSIPDRRVLLIAGAGFDPRSTRVAQAVVASAADRVRALLIREERPDPSPSLVKLADANHARLIELIPSSEVQRIAVFASDDAVVGGRSAARLISTVSLADVSDVFVDVSALSIGVAFPVINYLHTTISRSDTPCNLHVVCCDDPQLDRGIQSKCAATAAAIHGFRGEWGLDSKSRAAILWMPLLSAGKGEALRRIFQALQNVQKDTVVCPILPFPASNPRASDELIEEFSQELQIAWQVDARDLVYAHEGRPLDLYRTILKIDEKRRRIFESVGGSQIILSPLGSKALSLGALMAALDRPFTILYVESIGYSLGAQMAGRVDSATSGELVHIWLHGDVYGSSYATERGRT
ncbi:MAG: hypothetical protein ACKV0T_00455 [Planctomycetales bacterium]